MREIICKSDKKGYVEKHVYISEDDVRGLNRDTVLEHEYALRDQFIRQGWALVDVHIGFMPRFVFVDKYIFERKDVTFPQRSAIVRMRINFK